MSDEGAEVSVDIGVAKVEVSGEDLDEMCAWGILRKSGGKYKLRMSPDEARDEGLLKEGDS